MSDTKSVFGYKKEPFEGLCFAVTSTIASLLTNHLTMTGPNYRPT